jgi:hypothetical protein
VVAYISRYETTIVGQNRTFPETVNLAEAGFSVPEDCGELADNIVSTVYDRLLLCIAGEFNAPVPSNEPASSSYVRALAFYIHFVNLPAVLP